MSSAPKHCHRHIFNGLVQSSSNMFAQLTCLKVRKQDPATPRQCNTTFSPHSKTTQCFTYPTLYAWIKGGRKENNTLALHWSNNHNNAQQTFAPFTSSSTRSSCITRLPQLFFRIPIWSTSTLNSPVSFYRHHIHTHTETAQKTFTTPSSAIEPPYADAGYVLHSRYNMLPISVPNTKNMHAYPTYPVYALQSRYYTWHGPESVSESNEEEAG